MFNSNISINHSCNLHVTLAIFSFCSALPPLSMTLEMLGKYGFTSGATLVFTYTAEIYPTPIRSTATGTCGIFARVGTCIAPFLFQLRKLNSPDIYTHLTQDSLLL